MNFFELFEMFVYFCFMFLAFVGASFVACIFIFAIRRFKYKEEINKFFK